MHAEIQKWERNESVALVILQEIAADRRAGVFPATKRQKELLTDLNVEFSPYLTKKAASKLIDEAFRKKRSQQPEQQVIRPINRD